MPNKLLVVIPCYYEEEMLPTTYEKFLPFFSSMISEGKISSESRICFVDDGSQDKTWHIIKNFCEKSEFIKGIKLSANFGHQKAILAGMAENIDLFDCYITIDADLQDDFFVIKKMIDLFQENQLNCVYGVRNDRSKDNFFKRNTAHIFYKVMKSLKVPVIYNHADFRLIDNIMLKHFLEFKEKNLFIRGIIPSIGFKSESVYYTREEREYGESKYPLKKMISFAWDGITSFTIRPIRMVFIASIIFFITAFVLLGWIVFSYFSEDTITGWSSTLFIVTFFSGINLLSVGVIGEYIGKIYIEVKNRPRYIVEKKV